MAAPLLEWLLTHFPSHTHALTLVSDPHGLLRQPALQEALTGGGFRIADGGDPVALRQAWYAAQPVTPEHPLVVTTRAATNTLAYDLWQQGMAVDLSLAYLFPHLDAALLADLTLPQLDRIYQALAQQPLPAPLGRSATLDYVLLHAFGATSAQLGAPGPLLHWLAELHITGEVLPSPLCAALVPLLQRRPPLATWPLADLLADPTSLAAFAQEHWQTWVRHLGEASAPYASAIPFAADPAVQAALPLLVGCGLLTPLAVAEPASFPAWSHVALREDRARAGLLRWETTVGALASLLAEGPAGWHDWQAVAGHWADLTLQRYGEGDLPDPACAGRYIALADRVSPLFATWLQTGGYTQLANRRLPVPHQLHHIPWVLSQYVAAGRPVALLVLDGMSLATWRVIWPVWAGRHGAWRVRETLVLAQVPTITAISRQALLAGRPPRAFAASLTHNQQEAAYWHRFWQERGLAAQAVAYAAIAEKEERPLPSALDSVHTRALAVVLPDVDAMVHGATAGLAGLYAGLRIWLNNEQSAWGSRWLEALIDDLLARGYKVTLTSDHGHVAATGIGQPQEGVTVTTRAKRARIYPNATFARNVQASFPGTTLWYDDGLLPDNTWVLMPDHAGAFATYGQRVVSHGGITLDETIVPFIEIEQDHG